MKEASKSQRCILPDCEGRQKIIISALFIFISGDILRLWNCLPLLLVAWLLRIDGEGVNSGFPSLTFEGLNIFI